MPSAFNEGCSAVRPSQKSNSQVLPSLRRSLFSRGQPWEASSLGRVVLVNLRVFLIRKIRELLTPRNLLYVIICREYYSIFIQLLLLRLIAETMSIKFGVGWQQCLFTITAVWGPTTPELPGPWFCRPIGLLFVEYRAKNMVCALWRFLGSCYRSWALFWATYIWKYITYFSLAYTSSQGVNSLKWQVVAWGVRSLPSLWAD